MAPPTSRILIYAGSRNPLLDQLQRHLSQRGLVFQLQSVEARPAKGRIATWLSVLRVARDGFSDTQKAQYDAASFHFFSPSALLVAAATALSGRPYSVHFWGSDFKYWRSRNNPLLRWVLRRARFVSFANSALLSEARSLWGSEVRLVTLRFGLDSLDAIDALRESRGSHGLQARRRAEFKTVVVGTNSQRAQQHAAIIQQLAELPIEVRQRFHFIFPLNYGDRANRLEVLRLLSSAPFEYEVLDRMIFGAELAEFRQSTDILIQIQRHDALSGAMLESLYAGACVITGQWLPYDDLRKAGVDWIEVESASGVAEALNEALNRMVDTDRNERIASSLGRWSLVAEEWLGHYRRAIEEGRRDT